MNNKIQTLSALLKPSYITRQISSLKLPRAISKQRDDIESRDRPNDFILPTEAQVTARLGWSGFISMQSMTIRGVPFDEVYSAGEKHLSLLGQATPPFLPSMQIWQSFATSLSVDTDTFAHDEQAELDLMANLRAMHVKSPLSWHYILKSQALYLLGSHLEAAKTMRVAESTTDLSYGQRQLVEQSFYDSLILAAIYPDTTPTAQRYLTKKLVENLKMLKESTTHYPDDVEHKYLLVSAEMARLLGNEKEAIHFYHEALTSANQNGFIQNEALAHELLGKYWLAKGKEEQAQLHLISACEGYKLWGASRKVQNMQRHYAPLLHPTSTYTRNDYFANRNLTSRPLDFATIFNTCQTISTEMGLGWLLEEVVDLLLQSSHAERAVIILKKEDQWLIQAEGKAASNATNVLQSLPIDHPQACQLPTTLINNVAQTKESIILNHNTANTGFNNDPYLRQQKPSSLLWLPLLHRGQVHGIIYLETHEPNATFPPETVQSLKFLSWQTAMLIEKAGEVS